MSAFLKTLVIVGPVLLVVLGLRACASGEGDRWLDRAREWEDALELVVDDEDLIVIAPNEPLGHAAAAELRHFLPRVVREHGALLGEPRREQMVAVLFSDPKFVRAFAGRNQFFVPNQFTGMHGYTDPLHGALFVPVEQGFQTLRHEAVHWIMGTATSNSVAYSPWLSEGLAQLFESDPPGVSPDGVEYVRATMPGGASFDVDRLIHLEDYQAFVSQMGARNYAEALVLTAFLFHKRPRSLLQAYVEEERRSLEGRPLAFHELYHHEDAKFGNDLAAYLREVRTIPPPAER
ncbi:MAG: DUF1570 domain-containing protein [Planctomycetota bacterium]|nr:DUF1570 domain-containing protein [Planctomycetota bacterium]